MSKILAIDDKNDNLVTIKALLKAYIPGCDVVTAISGRKGIELAISEQPDTIILDVKMPELDGYEVCKRLKAEKSTKHIPIILFTAINTDTNNRIKGLEIGADAFLTKPIDPPELIAEINVLLRIKKAEDELRQQKDRLEDVIAERTIQLKEKEEWMRTALEGTDQGLWDWDVDNGTITFDNNWPRVLGYQPGERDFDYTWWENSITPESKTAFEKALNAYLIGKEKFYELEYQIKNKTGEYLWIKARGICTNYTENGRPRRLIGTQRNITKNKQAEYEQQRLRRNLESLWNITTQLDSSIQEISNTVLNEIIKMTDSKYGFYGFMNDDGSSFILHSWSKDTMKDCSIQSKPIHYPVEKAGIWADAIRTRKEIIVNDYKNSTFQNKKGLPGGHVEINNFIAVPVIVKDTIVAIGAVANKDSDYTMEDVNVIRAYMENANILFERKKIEEKIIKSLKEKDVLIKEIHHRVKNNMQLITSLLGIQIFRENNDFLIKALTDTRNRIVTMSKVHEILYHSKEFANINFSDFFDIFLIDILSLYSEKKSYIQFEKNIENIILPLNIAIPCALIVNELITNSYQHAFPENKKGTIKLSFTTNNDHYSLHIVDDGVGFNIEDKNKKSLGLDIVDTLVLQLRGKMNIKTDEGSSFNIEFSLKYPKHKNIFE